MRQSITTQLFRFTFERVHAIILYVVSILSFAVGMVFLFFTVFQCSPVEYYWERLTMQGHCLNTNLLTGITYFYSAVAAACDLTIGLLPAFLIRPLRASHRTKIGVAVILGIGCVFVSTTGILSSRNNFVSSASAAVIVRIPFLDSIKSDEFLRTQPPNSHTPLPSNHHGRCNEPGGYMVQYRSRSGYHSWESGAITATFAQSTDCSCVS